MKLDMHQNISLLVKPASGNCNMHCDYCFYCDEMQQRSLSNHGWMQEETMHNVLKRLFEICTGSLTIAFQGGEPTLRGLDFYKHVLKMEQALNIHGVNVSHVFQTNGILINQEWADFFHQHRFLVGVSLDGTQQVNDTYRHLQDCTSTFDKVMANIDFLKQADVNFNILTVVTKETCSHLNEIYSFYKAQGFHYQQYIACLDSLDKTNKTHYLTPEDYGNFLIELFQLWYNDLKQGTQPYIRSFENYIGILLRQTPESCDMCGSCGIHYVVEANGNCYPCDFYMLDENLLGNFNTNTVEEMDLQREAISFIEKSRIHPDTCKQCHWYPLCRNGCQRMRDDLQHNRFCESYQKFFETCASKMEEIAQMAIQKNTGGKS